MEIQDLIDSNPWWKTPSAIHTDQKIVEQMKAPVKWLPKVMESFVMTKDRIYALRGPQQVGKTTLLKLMIRDLLSKDIEPRTVFYYSCDAIDDFDDLVEVIRTYRDFSGHVSPERRFLFIDEISSVREWERGIKILSDSGELAKATTVLTDSHSMDLKYSTERLPGRRGEGEDTVNKLLIPMRFSEYVFTLHTDIRRRFKGLTSFNERLRIVRSLFEGEIDPVISKELVLYSKEIRTLLDDYLLTGGIIRPISEFHRATRRHVEIANSIYELYVSSLASDLARWRFQEKIAKQVLRSVVRKMTTRMSLSSIAKESEIGHHRTISRYLGALEDSFVLQVLYPLALDKMSGAYARELKVYFSDPFLFHAVSGWVTEDSTTSRSHGRSCSTRSRRAGGSRWSWLTTSSSGATSGLPATYSQPTSACSISRRRTQAAR